MRVTTACAAASAVAHVAPLIAASTSADVVTTKLTWPLSCVTSADSYVFQRVISDAGAPAGGSHRGNVTVIVSVIVAPERMHTPSPVSGHVQSMFHVVKASLRRPLLSTGPCASIDARSCATLVPVRS